MMVTGFRNVSDVYRFLHATVSEAKAGMEEGTLTLASEDQEYTIDLEYVCATVTSVSHRLVLTYHFLSQGDIFSLFARYISEEYPHLLITHLVIDNDEGNLRLRQVQAETVRYDRVMPPVVGSAVLEELESEPVHDETLTLHLRDLVTMTESQFVKKLGVLKTPVFTEA